jgi:hypothetical protein
MNDDNKKSYRIEKTKDRYKFKIIDKQQDKPVFTITFVEELSFEEKEQIMIKINSVLN